MTEDALLKIRRSNLATMRRELYKLKREYEELFKDWLKQRGEYTIEVRMLFHKFREKAEEYKELRFKVLANENGL